MFKFYQHGYKGGTLGRIKLHIPKRLPLFSRKTSMGFLDYVRKQ